MSNKPRRSVYFGPHEDDDTDATGLPHRRRAPGEDPLSPTFGVPHENLAIAPSPPSGFVALHPAAVEAARELRAAHDARVAARQPGYIPGAEAPEPPQLTSEVDRTESRDSTATESSRLAGPFLSALRRTFSKERR
ncbi:hypothetical protein FRC12_010567 [Ceratobasidium sp. 428]|nr:hypothetical protein FRC12_010567 [Ceratobasidium sp. 428]